MPKRSRIEAVGALYHVVARGIERRKIFEDEADHTDFSLRLGRIANEADRQGAWNGY